MPIIIISCIIIYQSLFYIPKVLNAEIKLPKALYIPDDQYITNERTFSGPMGMGLIKSFEYNNQKFCIYNNIKGQKKITLPSTKQDCPKKIGE